MTTEPSTPQAQPDRGRFDWIHLSLFVLVAIFVTAIATGWIIKVYVFPSEFRPVTLSQKEERVLGHKLQRLGWGRADGPAPPTVLNRPKDTPANSVALEPEPYSEAGASREVSFSERELNAMLAKNTDLEQKLAIDLSDNLISAKLLVPVDEDFPILGGKILRARAGLELAYLNGKPVVVLKGISVMGVPLPNAWMGGIKNIDLVEEFGGEKGFWKAFSDGVEFIQVAEGELKIKLKE